MVAEAVGREKVNGPMVASPFVFSNCLAFRVPLYQSGIHRDRLFAIGEFSTSRLKQHFDWKLLGLRA